MSYINTNSMAMNTARNLSSSYARLAVSTERLSSGLRINSSADDAAGLAIRELMRADIAALYQGMRNANDAISLLQTADSALAIIDEKLIRMKELAEQAATGTYNSTQRLMIDSEFQAMGSEIDRIARATDFNGIKLLDGSLSGTHDGSRLDSSGKMKIHFGSANDSAEDYYYIQIGDCSTKGLGLHDKDIGTTIDITSPNIPAWFKDPNTTIDFENKKAVISIDARRAGNGSPAGIPGLQGQDYYELPEGLENVRITSKEAGTNPAHKPHVNLFTRSGKQLTGVPIENSPGAVNDWWNSLNAATVMNALENAGLVDAGATWSADIAQAGVPKTEGGMTILVDAAHKQDETMGHDEIITVDKITSNLVFIIGGHQNGNCNNYQLTIEADIPDSIWGKLDKVSVELESTSLTSIATQENAQKTLERIDNAMIRKDKVRANLGALQNRFENTATNLSIQAQNLQASESRISDADIGIEMTNFVKNQILTQAGVAMLSQANSVPQMLMSLIR